MSRTTPPTPLFRRRHVLAVALLALGSALPAASTLRAQEAASDRAPHDAARATRFTGARPDTSSVDASESSQARNTSTVDVSAPAAKRPLTQAAFDSWRAIRDVALSNDGRWAAWSLVPQVGDGEVVLRDLRSGKEVRHTRGYIGRPQMKPGATRDDAIRFPAPRFTADGKYLVFTIEPSREEYEKARHAKRGKDADRPRSSLGILRTADGQVDEVPRVKSFKLASGSSRWLAYLLASRDSAAADSTAPDSAAPGAAAVPGGVARPVSSDSTGKHAKKQYGSTLVLRDLESGEELRIADVGAYDFDDPGQWLAYTVASRDESTNGAYARSLADGRTLTLLSGVGAYKSLAIDSAGTVAAFISDRAEQGRDEPRFSLYAALLRDRAASPKKGGKGAKSAPAPADGSTAQALVTPAMLGDTLLVSTDARIEFSSGGTALRFGVAPFVPDSIPADSLADKAVFNLWHYRDGRLQPEQRIEAARDRKRSFTSVYDLRSRDFRILGSDSLPEIHLSPDFRIAMGETEVPYRVEAMWGEGGRDLYAIDVATGKRTQIASRVPFRASLSPAGGYILWFGENGHWYSYSTATKRSADITGSIAGVRFDQETWDTPSTAAPWGIAGWTEGEKSVLLYDRYDVWEVDPSGREPARVLTDSVGRHEQIIFRLAEMDTTDRFLSSARPLLLEAMDDSTKASGYWSDRIGAVQPPKQLIMEARRLADLQKAPDADVYLFTRSTFREFPDLWVTDASFSTPTRISEANPQQAEYRWGTAQLVHWLSDDGVPLAGILYKPEDFDPNRKYPMLVYFYEQLSDNLHHYVPPAGRNVINPTVYVSNDYLVFEPDIHYEIGYPGESAVKSVVPGVQMLIDSGFVDRHAVGLQGQSWGGYQVAYIITQTSMFRAAMAGAPVANMTSAYGGIRWASGLARAFQYEHTQSRIGGSIWEQPLRYLRNSPLFWADRIRTPLFIMHNDGDGAVPWYQGVELFVALRRLGKEVYLIDYNDEAHNPTKRANQLDIAMRMQQFFDHHLKGAPAPDWMVHGIPFLDKGRDQLEPVVAGEPVNPETGSKEASGGGTGPVK
ncbi:MAG TPA: prolyl oligopeptidase family serine peptidase [Gemmatimonadaceae bacterium]|nr:prolyl oligopeptidase family serine peptidase [Gemmatimonadaceae bacterium]